MTVLDEYWQNFLKSTGRDTDEKCSGDLFFEAKGFVSDQLTALVLSEKKTAFFTSNLFINYYYLVSFYTYCIHDTQQHLL